MSMLITIALLLSSGVSAQPSALQGSIELPRRSIGSASLHRDGKKAIRKGLYEKAIGMFDELVKRNPGDTQARVGLALASLKLSNFRLCYDQALQVIEREPGNARAHALAGAALLRSGYVSNAAAEVARAHELDSKEPLAYGIAAEIDYCEGRSADARLKAFKANKLDPGEPDYLMTIARASSRLERFAETAAAYEAFLRVSPENDKERRDRIKGLIDFYRRLDGLDVYEISGPPIGETRFMLGGDRRPYLKLKVNGRDATFVIDTGSSFTVISTASAKRLGVSKVARGGNSHGFGGNGRFPIVYGLIKNLDIGEVKIRSVPCFLRTLHTTGDAQQDENVDGFIGLSVFAHFVTELDYQGSMIRFDRSADRPAPVNDTSIDVPFRTTQNGLISVETELAGQRINAIVDSAASSSVVSTAAVDRLNLRDNIIKGDTATVIGAAGVADNVARIFVPSYRVAGVQRDNLRALVMDFSVINEDSGFEQSGILGGDFLRHFKVTIDFNRTVVTFQPHNLLPAR